MAAVAERGRQQLEASRTDHHSHIGDTASLLLQQPLTAAPSTVFFPPPKSLEALLSEPPRPGRLIFMRPRGQQQCIVIDPSRSRVVRAAPCPHCRAALPIDELAYHTIDYHHQTAASNGRPGTDRGTHAQATAVNSAARRPLLSSASALARMAPPPPSASSAAARATASGAPSTMTPAMVARRSASNAVRI